MVYGTQISIVSGANLNKLKTWGPHIVPSINPGGLSLYCSLKMSIAISNHRYMISKHKYIIYLWLDVVMIRYLLPSGYLTVRHGIDGHF